MFRIRYKTVSILLLIGLSVALSAVLNMLSFQDYYNNKAKEMKMLEKYTTVYASFGFNNDEIIIDPGREEDFFCQYLVNDMEEFSSNRLFITNGYYINAADTTVIVGTLVFGDLTEEDIVKELPVASFESAVYVREDYRDYLIEEDGFYYLELDSIKRPVKGITGSMTSYPVINEYQNLSSNDVETFFCTNFFCLSEQAEGSEYILQYLQNILSDIGIELTYTISAGDVKLQNLKNQSNMMRAMFLILFCFSVIDCCLVIDIWIIKRKTEIAIRQVMGYGTGRIYGMVLKDFLIYEIIASLFAFVIAYASQHNLHSINPELGTLKLGWMGVLEYILALIAVAAGLSLIFLKHLPKDKLQCVIREE